MNHNTSSPNMEVDITLTPTVDLDTTKPRHFTLNTDIREMRVGRAARSSARGLQPAHDNTIFDSPILSRQHACFTASPTMKEVYIKDLGSTHGTFVGPRKVMQDRETMVKNGETVTFGVRVVNGALTYPAQSFCFEHEWRSRYGNKSTKMSPETIPSNVYGSFRVPDSDIEIDEPEIEDAEEVSIHSRESSVQVVDSSLRATAYSVPSDSDSESDYFNNDNDDLNSSSSIPTHENDVDPHKDDGAKAKTMDLNLKGPKLQDIFAKSANEGHSGSSQNNPIELDNSCNTNHQTDAARDPAPNVDHGQVKPLVSALPSTHEHKEKRQLVLTLNTEDVETEDEGPDVLPIQGSAKRSNITELLDDDAIDSYKPSTEDMFNYSVNDLDHATAHDSQIDRMIRKTQRRMSNGQRRPEERGRLATVITDAIVEAEDLNHLGSVAGATIGSDDEDEIDELDQDFPIDFDEADDLDAPHAAPLQPTVVPRYCDLSSHAVDFSAPPSETPFAQRAPSPSDAALVRNSSNPGFKPGRHDAWVSTSFDNSYTIPPLSKHHLPMGPPSPYYHWAPAQCISSTPAQDGYSMSQVSENTGLGTYTTGPFACSRRSTSPAPLAPAPISDSSVPQPLVFPQLPVQSRAVQPKTAADQSSKLNIANLVNSYYGEESSQSSKRKAADISTDQGDTHYDTAQSDTAFVQESLLPEAQPREPPISTETSISQGGSIEPFVSSITTTVTTETSSAEEPALKKAKTKASSTSGIGKFLTGVAVGAVGLAATFLATIPTSVHEEVLANLSG